MSVGRMFEEWQIDKENFESYLDEEFVPLSDTVWAKIVSDVEGTVGNYLDELLERTALDVQEGFYDD